MGDLAGRPVIELGVAKTHALEMIGMITFIAVDPLVRPFPTQDSYELRYLEESI